MPGGPFGATNIDRAFLQLLQTRVKNFDEVVQVSGAGGHFVVREKGRVLLRRFERLKHDFALGWNGGDVATPRGLMLKSQEGDADQEADDTGVINISL